VHKWLGRIYKCSMIDGLRVKASTYDQKISGKCLILKF
jgi:hypothetical protein